MSQSTVSLVFSGKGPGRISAQTEAAVRAAAATLGYRPNLAARALRSGTASTIALVVPDVRQPFFARTLRGAQAPAREAGFVVAMFDTGRDRAWGTATAEALGAGSADGLLLFGIEPPAHRPAEAAPIVIIESVVPGYAGVRLDVEAGTDAAVGHLLELGHRRIGHLASAADADTFRRRRRRVEALAGPDTPRAGADFSPEAARDATLALLGARPDLTALFCDDDVLASGAYLAARELARRIPEDLSVVGFDDLDVARVLDPPLTTIGADAEATGRAAFELLQAVMEGRRPRSRIQPVELLIRGSTGPPHG